MSFTADSPVGFSLLRTEEITSAHSLLFFFFPVEFDDCAGNKDVTFEVSDPSFKVDGDQNLVPLKDGMYSGPVLSIHGISELTDDLAQVEITGLPVQSLHTVRVSRALYMCLFVT